MDQNPKYPIQHPHQNQQVQKLRSIQQIRSGGKHHSLRPRIKGQFTTSYSDHYKNTPSPQTIPQLSQPKSKQIKNKDDGLMKKNEDNLKQRPVNIMNPQSPQKQESMGSKIIFKIPFFGESSYKQQFKPFVYKQSKNLESQKLQNPLKIQYRSHDTRSPPKFQGLSSYKQQFVQPPKVMANSMPEPIVSSPKRIKVPFYAYSTYKNDFLDFKFQPINKQKSQQFLPNHNHILRKVKFEGQSSYQDQFCRKMFEMGQRKIENPNSDVQKMTVPPVNHVNNQNHIYYDPEKKVSV